MNLFCIPIADDIQVTFFEDTKQGIVWEAYGEFSSQDVHRQACETCFTFWQQNIDIQLLIAIVRLIVLKIWNENALCVQCILILQRLFLCLVNIERIEYYAWKKYILQVPVSD